jgi:hypothetical protein
MRERSTWCGLWEKPQTPTSVPRGQPADLTPWLRGQPADLTPWLRSPDKSHGPLSYPLCSLVRHGGSR